MILSNAILEPKDRASLHSIIKSALVEKKLQNNEYQKAINQFEGVINVINSLLLNGSIITTFADVKTLQSLLNEDKSLQIFNDFYKEACKLKENSINELCKSQQVFIDYVALVAAGAIGIDPHCACLIARQRQCNLFIWENSSQSASELVSNIYNYQANNMMTYHLYINNNQNVINLLVDIKDLLRQENKLHEKKIHKIKEESDNNNNNNDKNTVEPKPAKRGKIHDSNFSSFLSYSRNNSNNNNNTNNVATSSPTDAEMNDTNTLPPSFRKY
jgi:hypothetical protein